MRSPSIQTDKDEVKIYSLEELPSIHMTKGSMLLVALLSGGDYSKVRLFCV